MAKQLPGYRPNVGIALFNPHGRVWIGRRSGRNPHAQFSWQMPQGGVDADEALLRAALRELEEETGVPAGAVERLGEIDDWLTYEFPPDIREKKRRRGRDWVGQKQKWFAMRFLGEDADVRLDAQKPPEFDAWRWERLERTPDLIIPWKRPVYDIVVREFAKFAA